MNARLRAKHFQVSQGISADLIATPDGLTREQLDRFALASQRRATRADREGRFAKSLLPVRDPNTSDVLMERDERPRPETTLSSLLALPSSFEAMGAAPVGSNGRTLDELERCGRATALVTLCIAGVQGIATIVERE